jgi:SAM-dependent methyltransferase
MREFCREQLTNVSRFHRRSNCDQTIQPTVQKSVRQTSIESERHRVVTREPVKSTAQCVACSGTLLLFGRRLQYEYHRCTECGTIQLHPLPSPAELARAYAAEYATAGHYEGDANLCRMSARTYYQSMVRVLKDHHAEGLVVDYGAGWGGLCELLIAEGFRVQGVEPSDMMAAHCRKKGLPVQHGDLSALQDKEEQIGTFALNGVFEHLVAHDVWLKHVHRLLAPRGLFVTLQPTAPFANLMGRVVRFGNVHAPLPALHQFFCPPWHTVLFSLDGMKQLMAKHGFDLLDIRPAPQGRVRGIMGLAQITLETINRVGWKMMRRSWPLLTAHTFVFRKT